MLGVQAGRVGITPAHAGKRRMICTIASDCKDHPRPCGEKAARLPSTTFQRGSPPPMRGKGRPRSAIWLSAGITPAHAGKRTLIASERQSNWDHPRPCGEKRSTTSTNVWQMGSPPPMRGKDGHSIRIGRDRGITPAHAGKSTALRLSSTKARDHPRPCGEKAPAVPVFVIAEGSPPPMRGKVEHIVRLAKEVRITPAHAGKRTSIALLTDVKEDHPRPCGEKYEGAWREVGDTAQAGLH